MVKALRRLLVVTILALLVGGCFTYMGASGQAVDDNKPYYKAGLAQAEITTDRFDCERDLGASSWFQVFGQYSRKDIDLNKLDACMLNKGYTVTRTQ